MARKRDIESGKTPPSVPAVNPAGIPADLRDCAQWVLWKYERRADSRGVGRWTKIPIRSLTRSPASSTDPDTWTTFDNVMAVYTRTKGEYAGIGFVFHVDDPYCGVDLDDVRDKDTGEIVAWACDFIRRLGSYAEVSPSGTGIKVIMRGYVPGGRKRIKHEGGEVEVYDCGRFFVITGQRIDLTPGEIVDAQDALDAIYAEVFAEADAESAPAQTLPGATPVIPADLNDQQLLDRMLSSARGDTLRRLWFGDTATYEDDHSRADLALCCHLAWWCQGNRSRVDTLFRQSGLMRAKWDTSRGGGTYGSRTIDLALRVVGGNVYNPTATRAPVLGVSATAAAVASSASTIAADDAVAPAGSQTVPQANPISPPVLPANSSPRAVRYHRLCNYTVTPTIMADGRQILAARGMSVVEVATPMLAATNNWPRSCAGHLFVPHAPDSQSPGVRWIATSAELFGWYSRLMSPGNSGNAIDWNSRGQDMLRREDFFSDLVANVHAYDAVESYPHEPLRPNVYYRDYRLAGGDGRAVNEFLDFFNPATDCDRDLLLSVLLTGSWGGEPGQRPAFVFVSPDGRGAGKTTAAQQLANLWDGYIKVRVDDDFAEVQKRVLSPAAVGKRFFLVDNVKESRLSSADMEDMITCDRISGRQMYTGEGSLPNYFTWLMTYNGVQLSADLAQRSIIIQLRKPRAVGQWARRIGQFVAANRPAILGDLVAILRRPPAVELVASSRWALWESEILSRVTNPIACQESIQCRQGEVDDDTENMELVREEFVETLRRNGYAPDRSVVFFTSRQAVRIAGRVTLGPRQVVNSPARLRLLNIPELRKERKTTVRGFLWVGADVAHEKGDSMPPFIPENIADREFLSDNCHDNMTDFFSNDSDG